MARYPDSAFTAAYAAGCTTARQVAAHVWCSLSTATRRMVRETPRATRAATTPEDIRAKLERISSALRLALAVMDWAERDDYVSACHGRAVNPLRRVA